MSEERTEFDYLLNAFELASQSEKPAEQKYAEKRRALFAYVRKLEAPTIPAEVGRRAMEALTNVCKNFPTDFDMADLGWDSLTVETACTAYDKARAAITELQQYLGEKK